MQILQETAAQNGPLCVGLDTDPSYLPEPVLKGFGSPADAVLAYNLALIDGVAGRGSACCFKVQIAYYEAMGLRGMEVYAETVRAVRRTPLVCISDVKRGDIAASASSYARAHFSGDFETDIITVNPYMGFDTLRPFTEYCKNGKGVFVLLRTSNPGMQDLEQQTLKDGTFLLDKVGDELNRLSREFKEIFPEETCSPVGAVVGCTEKENARALRDAYKDIFFLIPGYGAQGGDARIAASLLSCAGGTVNSSRGILCAWKKDLYCVRKAEEGTVTLDDVVSSALRACDASKEELMAACKE